MKLIFWIVLLFPFLARAGTDDGTILLHNDTTMILTAIIHAADGRYLGQLSVQPGQQKWTTSLFPTPYVRPGAPDVSLTPYTVIWQCPSEGIFSMCTGVSPGSYVRATICEGGHFCSPKQEQKEGPPPASKLKKIK